MLSKYADSALGCGNVPSAANAIQRGVCVIQPAAKEGAVASTFGAGD
jgi:hypothetical protein